MKGKLIISTKILWEKQLIQNTTKICTPKSFYINCYILRKEMYSKIFRLLCESDIIQIYCVRYLPTTSVRQIIIEWQNNKPEESVASDRIAFIYELKQVTFQRSADRKEKHGDIINL